MLSVEDYSTGLGLTTQIVQPLDPSRMCDYMHQALNSLAEALEYTPTIPVRQLNILPNEERELLLDTWNATEEPYQDHQCIHQLFEDQVESNPHATALVYEDQVLSYFELNARANSLAYLLIELGVQPEVCVAICVERSIAMVIGLLAVLKAGGAYVPLDPAYPSERLKHIITDASPSILLAEEIGRLALGKEMLTSFTVLDPNRQSTLSNSNPKIHNLDSHHLAYVIYTSGSTGIPKGVMVEHRGVANLAQAQIANFGVSSSSRVLQFASLSFDVSVVEIVMALSCGAGLYIPPNPVRSDPNELWKYLERHGISHAILPPALLQDGKTLPILKTPLTIALTGEAPSAALLQTLGKQAVVFNAYGPTETTVWSTTWRLSLDVSSDLVPIGRPITNTRIYLLDSHGLPVPLGAVGELYIGGVGVARGYLNRPELTADRFPRDPFDSCEDARMYKTGDLARYLSDGNIAFLGRNDEQVKIRGFRIEPGEIESRLVEHPLVNEAIVVMQGDDINKRLVAYIVAEPYDKLASTLRAHLVAQLPEYMIPSAFVHLDELPLTPNGKLNRRALPQPNEEAFAYQAYEAPQTKYEIALADIWARMLNVNHISRNDSFFALGGHSLLAIQMISRIRTTLGFGIALSTVFEAPTVAELAHRLLMPNGPEDDSFAVMLPLKPKGNRYPLFCVHSVIGLSWSYIGLSKYIHPAQPIYGLQSRGLDGAPALAESVETMASDYISQIRQIQPNGPYFLLGWSFGGRVAFAMATQLEQQGEKVALLAMLDCYPEVPPLSDDQEKNQEAGLIMFLARFSDERFPDAGEYLLNITRDIIKNNYHIGESYSPTVYNGDVLFFRATVVHEEFASLTHPDLWKPYVHGNIEVHDINSTHVDLDRPGPTAEIGPILARKIDDLQKSFIVEDTL
ncbi:hypothetical protein K7432_015203 [Basidiobolus ranarum]|uniref:Carrier domain-containing protein n=1 Tax=Basidiobolus ranarum TaxID=34480 RepID=A0ABR2WGI4_9FUNG